MPTSLCDEIRCREEVADKIRTSPNGIVCSKILVEQNMPDALDVVKFDIVVLLQQISRAGDVAVSEALNGDVCDGPEI